MLHGDRAARRPRASTATAGSAPTARAPRSARTPPPASRTTCSPAGRASPTPTSSRTRAASSRSSRSACPTEVRPDLSTVGRVDFGGALRSPMTAHPKIDPVTGEMHFFGYDIMGPPWLRYHVVDASGALVRSVDITIAGPSMVHDFAITERNVVFFDLPVVYDFAPARPAAVPRRSGSPTTARASASCRATAATPTCGGPTSSSATCTTRLNAYDDGPSRVGRRRRRGGPRCSPPTGTGPARRRRPPSTAGPSTPRPARSSRNGSTTVRRSSRGSTNGASGGGTGSGTQPRPSSTDRSTTFGALLQHDLDRGTVTRHDFGARHRSR